MSYDNLSFKNLKILLYVIIRYIVKHNKNMPYNIIMTKPITPEPAKTNANIIGIISAVKAMVINRYNN